MTRKGYLRACAQQVLQARGCRVKVMKGAGQVPGTRLRVWYPGSEASRKVAIRTSADREFGFTRQADGSWTGISRMDEVIVSAPSAGDPACAEVLSFNTRALVAVLEKALEQEKLRTPSLSHKTPIFLPLDHKPGGSERTVGLKPLSNWSQEIPFSSVPKPVAIPTERVGEFIERVRREYAELTGVEIDRVRTEFRIVDPD